MSWAQNRCFYKLECYEGARAGMTRSPEEVAADRGWHWGSARGGCLTWACKGAEEFIKLEKWCTFLVVLSAL